MGGAYAPFLTGANGCGSLLPTVFVQVWGNAGRASCSSAETEVAVPLTTSTAGSLLVKLGHATQTPAPGGTNSITFTVMKNGAATALSCTVTGAQTGCTDLVNSVDYATGDTISIRITNNQPGVPDPDSDLRAGISFNLSVP